MRTRVPNGEGFLFKRAVADRDSVRHTFGGAWATPNPPAVGRSNAGSGGLVHIRSYASAVNCSSPIVPDPR